MSNHLIIIDGLSFLFRAYHAVRPLTRSDGLPTNALYGFSQMLIKVVKDLKPDLCVVALDSPAPTFRKELYPEYKAHRTEPDEEMKTQIPLLQPLIEAFGIQALRVDGVEADDIIATLATQHKGRTTIVSSDKDLMQLINDDIHMLDTMKNKEIDEAAVMEKFGVTPNKVIEVQALIGDSSDNIPGVPGIGPKTAAQLIGEFQTVENLYENLDKIPQEKRRVSLQENKENAYLSKILVTLKRDVPLKVSEDSLKFTPTLQNAQKHLLNLEFRSLSERLGKPENGFHLTSSATKSVDTSATPQTTANYIAVTTKEQLEVVLNHVRNAGVFAFDTETTSLNVMTAEIVGLSLSWGEGQAAYIPLTHTAPVADLLSQQSTENSLQQIDKKHVFEKLTDLFTACSEGSLTVVGHNLKYDFEILLTEGFTLPKNFEDTLLISFSLNGGKYTHGLDDLALRHFDHKMIAYKEVCGTGKSQIPFNEVEISKATDYAAEDADYTLRLFNLFKPQLSGTGMEKVNNIYSAVEKPLVPVLADMERAGICVDRGQLEKLSLTFAEQIADLEKQVHTLTGTTFNLNSPKQLSEVLFDQLGLTVKGKKPTSTNVTVLEALMEEENEQGQKIAEALITYRQLSKLRSTYTEALISVINPKTGRVHTSYNQTGAATGRFSSSDPNLQNIPIRTENGRKIRRAFIAQPNWTLLAADYSQIELRLLAHFSGAESLVQAFQKDQDIHAVTAHQLFNCALEEVTPDQRRIAKTINFGLIYGMGAASLARQIGIPKADAIDYIGRYFQHYSGIKSFMETQVEFARTHGYVETLMGRRVHLPEINSKNGGLKAQAERAAINAPLQGSNADIIKHIMPKIHEKLKQQGLKTRMLLQVHDELVFECPEAELQTATPLIKSLMESAANLSVPLKVSTGTGQNWEDAH